MEGGTHSEPMHSDNLAMKARALTITFRVSLSTASHTLYIECTSTKLAMGFRFHLGQRR